MKKNQRNNTFKYLHIVMRKNSPLIIPTRIFNNELEKNKFIKLVKLKEY